MALKWTKEVVQAQGLHKRDRNVLRELADMANRGGLVWARQETIGFKLGITDRTVRTALKNLEAAGWIWRRKRHRKDGSRQSDMIQLRTMAEAAQWLIEQQPELALEGGKLNRGVRGVIEGGKGDGPEPDPGREAEPPARQPVDTSARRPVDRKPPAPANDAAQLAGASIEQLQAELERRLRSAKGLDRPPIDRQGRAPNRRTAG